jgi:uncharacterized protein (DUF58 family)
VKHATRPDKPDFVPALVMTSEGIAWLGVALVMGAAGWLKSLNVVLLLAYLMLALLIVNAFLARAHARRVHAAREPTHPVYAGETATVRVRVTSTSRRSATVTVRDDVGSERVAWLVNRIAPGASTVCEARRALHTRGRYRASVHVSATFPLGLLQCDRPEPEGTDLVVLPAPGHADPDGLRMWLHRHGGGDGRARKVLRRVTADQAEVRGVRAYRPGDPIRTIHWRSSARRHELMVREYDAAPAPELVLVIEPWLPGNPTQADRDAVESTLSLAATVARTWVRVYNTRLVVAVAGDASSVRVASGSDQSVREALAPVADVAGAEHAVVLPAGVFDRSLARAARLVISSRPNSPYADAMGHATGRRFLAVCPADPLPWYQPPESVVGDRDSGDGKTQPLAPNS